MYDFYKRYIRHVVLSDIGILGQDILLNAKVLCVGAGGLGSAALVYLASCGIGFLGIIDFDKVDLSNLNRQFMYNIFDLGKNKVYYDKKGETLNFYTRIALYSQADTGVFLSFNTYVPEHEINNIMNKATDLIYGEKQEYTIKNADSSIKIGGLYVNNWSSFNTPEKILRYFIPNKMIYIDTVKDGHYINGQKMTLIDEDLYSSDLGLLKFKEVQNKIIMSSESAITYVKVPLWQHRIIQMIIPIIFIIVTFIIFIRELIKKFSNKNNKYSFAFALNSFFQIVSFVILCLLMYKGIVTFSILKYAPYMKFLGWFIAALVISNIIIAIKNKKYKELLPAIWVLSGILFSAWMLFFHIL